MRYLNIIFLVLLLAPSLTHAFVENVTHGYVNCMACHVSPSGGGLVNDYGRSLSKELMSTWGGWKGFETPFFGAIKNHENLKIGGDIRSLQTHLENSKVKQGKQFLMQQNLEVGIQVGKVSIVVTLGTQEGPEGTPQKGEFLSERHYLLWESTEDTRVRVGKFHLNFGLYDSNHTRLVKAPLGFGSNSESYNLEFSKFTDDWEVFISSGLGRLDLPQDQSSERNLTATFARYFAGNSKIGVSALVGESPQMHRNLGGIFGILPVSEKGILKFETDYQKSTQATTPDPVELFASYLSAGYQAAQGLLPYIFFEYLHRDLSNSDTAQNSPGIGIQWLPIPHVELQAEYKRQTLRSSPDNPNDIGWILFHLYL